MTEAPAPGPTPAGRPDGSASTGRSGRVLVVEDDPAIAHLVDEYLRRQGYVVDVTGDGERGVQLARDVRPDVIIPDFPTLGAA